MPGLTDNEARALAYFVIGVTVNSSTEWQQNAA
ncbi:hypothetical protein J2T07_002507 [Luteibacter jiangsuensis]|uniref:Uncharacterized protein n=1 Tax=Luteibacter jiangsuensis TaxID=637577 RepID=A0ABT9T2A9_9GAMM|nr:hypothetical protein [Luteibacter jiangsuensis]